MSTEEMILWMAEPANKKLFKPTNSRPTEEQRKTIFEIANFVDSKGNHKPSSCGRCYYNALRAIERSLNIF